MRYLYLVLIILFFCTIIVFAVQNRETVTLSFLGWKTTLPLAFQVIIVYFLGMLTGGSVIAFLKKSFEGFKKPKDKPEK
ncbi:DUF1049 domain-containing protein [candidate division WOR-3 bacterium]|nr:DUF1049 domain-containing protein [candidate division WOR-3 bacterium]